MTALPFCLPANISAETFLSEYWQKKPLLIKNGLPQLVGMFEPDDIKELASFEDVTARLLTQVEKAKQSPQWTLKNSPFTPKDLKNLPEKWTLLVQNMEQWSPELAELWHAFDFIPQWQRDDIMVSYAPVGGSVGQHFDEYDVFLAQGFGARCWQLGKFCDDNTSFLPKQPIRLLEDMGEIIFDEVLHAGDVLYVPPRLAHFGVAMDDCLTFSFGFRRPNILQLLDSLTDVSSHEMTLSKPIYLNQSLHSAGQLDQASIVQIQQQLLALLNSSQGETLIAQAVAETVSKRQYDVLTNETYLEEDVLEVLQAGATISQDLASRIIYLDHPLQVFVNGVQLNSTDNPDEFSDTELAVLVRLANGETLSLSDVQAVSLMSLCDWLENGWIILNEPNDISDNGDNGE